MASPLRGLDGWSFYAFERDRAASLDRSVNGFTYVEHTLLDVDRWEVDVAVQAMTVKHGPV